MIPPTYRSLAIRAWDSLRGPTLWCRAGGRRRWYITATAHVGDSSASVSIDLTRAVARLVLQTIAEEREAAAAEQELQKEATL